MFKRSGNRWAGTFLIRENRRSSEEKSSELLEMVPGEMPIMSKMRVLMLLGTRNQMETGNQITRLAIYPIFSELDSRGCLRVWRRGFRSSRSRTGNTLARSTINLA
jgi:hypothetical protein